MRIQIYVLHLISLSDLINAEERLSWFTTDPEIKKSIFVPDNLSEGKEENRVLPWVFHDDENKIMELKCIMRGYNASNNPNDYQDARWSYPGFSDSQIDTSAPPDKDKDDDNGEPYAIWTIKINTSRADAGKKWATCEFQQGDFPLSTDFQFLMFRKVSMPQEKRVLTYDLGGLLLDEKDITQQVEEDIKRQISEYYFMPATSVTRTTDKFLITLSAAPTPPPDPTTPTTTKPSIAPATVAPIPTSTNPLDWLTNLLRQIIDIVFVQFNPFYHLFFGQVSSIRHFKSRSRFLEF